MCLTASLPSVHSVIVDSLYRLLLVVVEYNLSEKTTRGVVHVNNDILESGHGLERLFDQICSGRSEDLDPNVVWDFIVVLQLSTECKVRVGCSGVGDLNLLEPNLD